MQHPKTYTAERVIGNGSFGVVYQAVSMETNETVAIKKVYQDRRYKNRELQIMKELGYHPNIVTLHHAFYTNGEKPEELFLNVVMEYLSDTVHRVLKTSSKTRVPVPLLLAKMYVFQLARGLAFIHSAGICHRDIKPQNLLVCGRTHALKLCDFGSAKRLVAGEANVSYICSRYYRAPELIFGATNYDFVVDVWSLGCVFGELVTGSPLFPGENGVDQLVQIIKILGTPSIHELAAMNPNYTEFQFPNIKANAWKKIVARGSRPEAELDEVAALLESILQYDPARRLSCGDLMASEFFDDLRHTAHLDLPDGSVSSSFLFNYSHTELKNLAKKMGKSADDLVPEWARSRSGSVSTAVWEL